MLIFKLYISFKMKFCCHGDCYLGDVTEYRLGKLNPGAVRGVFCGLVTREENGAVRTRSRFVGTGG